ncbi:MAG: hypothetical protein ACRDBY_14150 [Cetobacterium sp.]
MIKNDVHLVVNEMVKGLSSNKDLQDFATHCIYEVLEKCDDKLIERVMLLKFLTREKIEEGKEDFNIFFSYKKNTLIIDFYTTFNNMTVYGFTQKITLEFDEENNISAGCEISEVK